MRFHVLGKLPRDTRPSEGSSLAVMQFVELIRGERKVQAPANMFRVETVVAEERYCLHCFGVRWFDMVYPRNRVIWKVMKRCRSCGKEGWG